MKTANTPLLERLPEQGFDLVRRYAGAVSRAAALGLAGWLSGCAAVPVQAPSDLEPKLAALPQAWRAPVPHEGSAERLSRWWHRFEDPLLVDLIQQAQKASPTLEIAAARWEQARAEVRQAEALSRPLGSGEIKATRSRQAPEFQAATSQVGQISASWELDLFGRLRAQHRTASAQADVSLVQWHEARVSLAADVASAYLALRHAQAQEEIAEWDARAAQAVAEWGEMRRKQGLESASDVAVLNAQAAAAVASRASRRAETAQSLQLLSVLTAQPAGPLAQQLLPPELVMEQLLRRVPPAPPFAWAGLPLNTLAQRPDLIAAHHQWLAAVYGEQGVKADSWPRLSLTSVIGYARWGSLSGVVGSLGPSLSLPLLDGGLQQGRREAAAARTRQAAAAFEARWRAALAEVEEALQAVASSRERQQEADRSQREWERVVSDASRLAAAGIQSGPQRVGAQRNALAAYSAAMAVRHEHAQAWVRLYRVLGGGFEPDMPGDSGPVNPLASSAPSRSN